MYPRYDQHDPPAQPAFSQSPGYPTPPVAYIQMVAPTPTSGLAVASLICGIAGLGCGLPAFAAVVLGHMATRETEIGERGGHGMAIAGLIMGYLVVGLMLVVLAFWIFAFALAAAGSSA